MERLFSLDAQLLHDALLLAIAIFVMFALMSYLLFNPARDMLKKRADKVKDNIDSAAKAKADADALRAEYESKLRDVQKEADAILSDARKKALENEAKIVEHAKEEAAGIIARAQKQAELEMKKAEDDIKKEIITVRTSWHSFDHTFHRRKRHHHRRQSEVPVRLRPSGLARRCPDNATPCCCGRCRRK